MRFEEETAEGSWVIDVEDGCGWSSEGFEEGGGRGEGVASRAWTNSSSASMYCVHFEER